jgi:hypothetical protein
MLPPSSRLRFALGFVALLAVAAGTGCNKIKAIGGDGDAAAGSGGGALSNIFGTDFEGEITMLMTSKKASSKKNGPQQIVFGIKKPKYRLDTVGMPGQSVDDPMNGGSMIIDLPTKKGYMLIHPKKMAMVIDFEKLKNMPKGQTIPGMPPAPKGAPGVPSQPPTIEKTGKKDVVAGYSCEIWNVTSDGKKSQLCAAEGITWIDIGELGIDSPEITLAAIASEANRFPLRVITFDPKGAEEFRMEATKVDKKSLDDGRFQVPPDYKVVDMSAMMNIPGVPGRAK